MDYLRSASALSPLVFFLLRGLRPSCPGFSPFKERSRTHNSLDTNDDPENLWAADVKDVLKSVDVFLPNEQEACKTRGVRDIESALEALSRLSPSWVIKCGAQGAVAKHGSKRFSVPALQLSQSIPLER